jgi:UDPglucose 6-dehydrogenase
VQEIIQHERTDLLCEPGNVEDFVKKISRLLKDETSLKLMGYEARNNNQQIRLVDKVKERFGSLVGMKVALLGLSFKPNTDDVRESASIRIANHLIQEGVQIIAFDPIAIDNARKVLPNQVKFTNNLLAAINLADAAFIITEWNEIKDLPLDVYEKKMKTPVIFDGRNCYPLNLVKRHQIEYHSIGRPPIMNLTNEVMLH